MAKPARSRTRQRDNARHTKACPVAAAVGFSVTSQSAPHSSLPERLSTARAAGMRQVKRTAPRTKTSLSHTLPCRLCSVLSRLGSTWLRQGICRTRRRRSGLARRRVSSSCVACRGFFSPRSERRPRYVVQHWTEQLFTSRADGAPV